MNCPNCNREDASRECYCTDEIGLFIYEYYHYHCQCGCDFDAVTTLKYESEDILRIDGIEVAEEV